MSDGVTGVGLTDDELERRLRSTYARVTATTRLTGRPLEAPGRRPLWPVRVSIAVAAVVVLALLGVVATRTRDQASGRGDGPRWAVVALNQWGFLGVRSYDATSDGLGEQRGDVITYGRDGATVQVMSLRGATLDEAGLAANPDGQNPVVFVSPDERLVVRHLGGDLSLVLRYEGDTDIDHVPDLTMLARSAVTVGEAAWGRLQQRQGFATLGEQGPEPTIEYHLDGGLDLRRYVSGSLRGGVWAGYRTVGADVDGTSYGVPMASDDPLLFAWSWDDARAVVQAGPPIRSLTVDGRPVPLELVVDPDSGVVQGWVLVELERGVHEVEGLDADGAVVATTRMSWPSGTEANP
jgi:hypothetical protein